MSDLTESEVYWSQSWTEVLFNNGLDIAVDEETHNSIARDFALCASVKGDYMAPVSGNCEIDLLKAKIKKLESRVPCHHCSGKGGGYVAVGSSHSSWSDCNYCNGNGWVY